MNQLLPGIVRRVAVTVATLSLLGFASAAPAQSQWPTKPIRFVVGFAAGGGSDLIARAVAQALGEQLGQPVIIDNKPGASGNLAGAEVARAPADGYTMFVGPTSMQSANPFLIKSNFNPAKELAPAAGIGFVQLFLVTRPGLPLKNVGELIAMAKANPGKLTYASSGPGTSPHLLTETFLQQTGTEAIHVPYRGAAPSLQGVQAGDADFVLDPGISFQFVRAGRMGMLAVASARRSPAFPDVPTMAESGVSGVDLDTWFGVWVPVGTPAEIVSRFGSALSKVLDDPAVRQRFAGMPAEAKYLPAPAFRKLLEDETRTLSKVITDRKIKLD
jgi:tripartite-type tricarboxylate transporter receptor subunit TctC